MSVWLGRVLHRVGIGHWNADEDLVKQNMEADDEDRLDEDEIYGQISYVLFLYLHRAVFCSQLMISLVELSHSQAWTQPRTRSRGLYGYSRSTLRRNRSCEWRSVRRG